MKSISKVYKKFINIVTSKKQILFALFALFLYLFFHKEIGSNITFSAIPAAVVAGAKAAMAAAKAGAKIGAIKGAAKGALNKNENESMLVAAAKGATKGAVNGAVNGAKGSVVNSAKGAYNSTKDVGTVNKNNTSQSTPRGSETSSQTKNQINSNPSKNSETSKDSKESSNSNDSKSNNKNKGFFPKPSVDSEIEETEESPKQVLKNGKMGLLAGCLVIPIFSIIAIPILLSVIISPISKIFNGLDCETSQSDICKEKNMSNFSEKAKNLILYGDFDTTDNVALDEVVKASDKIYEKYSVRIDIPTLLSSLFVDATEYEDEEVDIEDEETGKTKTIIDLNGKLKGRLKYIDDLAEKQLTVYEVVSVCTQITENNINIYKKDEISRILSDVSITEITENVCNEDNVGETILDYTFDMNLAGYYDRLKQEPEILKKIYGNDRIEPEENLKELLDEIMFQVGVFKILYDTYDEEIESGAGNVPSELFMDTNVNMRTPVNGSYVITSPFGYRPPIYKDGIQITRPGLHNGIDIVSNDLTLVASGDGIITYARANNTGSNMVKIEHTTTTGLIYVSEYGHLKSFLVKQGDIIKAGDPIGIMGTTGISTGVHLHFAVKDMQSNEYLNPLNLFINATNYDTFK